MTQPHESLTDVTLSKAWNVLIQIYDALKANLHRPQDPEALRHLNRLCVRIVFCLYAQDCGLFPKPMLFHDFLTQFKPKQMRFALFALFKTLNTPYEKRDEYLPEMDDFLPLFPFVNGGLFNNEPGFNIPPISEACAKLILEEASEQLDWSKLSPTLLGSLFEATLNPQIPHDGGMHDTSIENIHKVIEPLFLGELNDEFRAIVDMPQGSQNKTQKLQAFQDKLASLTFLDPACGSGNFLTETYIQLRRLENKVMLALIEGQADLGLPGKSPIKVGIHQFYGIEINDFADAVATTALWIAEAQMLKETEEIINQDIDFVPLKSLPNIRVANALDMEWSSVFPELSSPDSTLSPLFCLSPSRSNAK